MLVAGLAATSGITDADRTLGSRDASNVDVAAFDGSYARLRATHAPWPRTGYLQLPGAPGAQMARRYIAQYGLAPAIVSPVSLEDCLVPDKPCPLDAAVRVVMDEPSPEVLAFLKARFGFRLEALDGPVALLERSR